jgi:adenine/guanine/hypoxanthine permease
MRISPTFQLMRKRFEAYFQFRELGTNWRTEILAGCTTFVTMA